VEINKKSIQKTKIVSATLDTLWWKWTTHEGLKTFFGLDNKIDLTPGGSYEIYFLLDEPVGGRGGEGNQVLSFIPEQMLSFTWNAPPSIPEIRNQDYRTWVVIQFRTLDSKQTEVHLVHLGWLDGEKWDETIAYFENAWDMVLNALEESCKP